MILFFLLYHSRFMVEILFAAWIIRSLNKNKIIFLTSSKTRTFQTSDFRFQGFHLLFIIIQTESITQGLERRWEHFQILEQKNFEASISSFHFLYDRKIKVKNQWKRVSKTIKMKTHFWKSWCFVINSQFFLNFVRTIKFSAKCYNLRFVSVNLFKAKKSRQNFRFNDLELELSFKLGNLEEKFFLENSIFLVSGNEIPKYIV